MVGAKCKVSFDIPNSLASVLGFKQSIVSLSVKSQNAGEPGINSNVIMFGTVGKLILCRLTYLNPPFIAFEQKSYVFLKLCLYLSVLAPITQKQRSPDFCDRSKNFASIER